MQDQVLEIVREPDLVTSGYHMPDLVDIEFHWGSPELKMDAGLHPSTDPLPFVCFNFQTIFRWVQWQQNFVLHDVEEVEENSPPTTPDSG